MGYEKTCKILDEKEKLYKKYNRRVWIFRGIWIILIVVIIILPTYLPLELRTFSYSVLGIFIIFGIVADIFHLIRRHTHSLSNHEKLLLNLNKAIKCVDSYLGANMINESYLNELDKILGKIKNILLMTETFENIILYKYFGNEVFRLIHNFLKELPPAIHSKDEKRITQTKLVLDQMATFVSDYSSNITIQDINKGFQGIILERQEHTITEWVTTQINQKLTPYIRQRPTLSAISAFILIEGFAYYVGINMGVSKDAIYTVIFGLFPLAFAILEWLQTRSKK